MSTKFVHKMPSLTDPGCKAFMFSRSNTGERVDNLAGLKQNMLSIITYCHTLNATQVW